MATIVNAHAAKTQLSQLLARVEAGEDIVIARAGVPAVRLVPVNPAKTRRFGQFKMDQPPDGAFFDPLPEEELAAWE